MRQAPWWASPRLLGSAMTAGPVAAAVLLAAASAKAHEEGTACEATRDCPPPLACDVAGRCVRQVCDEDGVGCRSRRDRCLRGRCYGEGDPDPINLAVAAYLDQQKSAGPAVLLSLLIPGVGSLYAEDWWGFLPMTLWAGSLALTLYTLFRGVVVGGSEPAVGAGFILGGTVLGLSVVGGAVWAYASVDDYNSRLWDRTVRAAEAEWAACRGVAVRLGPGRLTLAW